MSLTNIHILEHKVYCLETKQKRQIPELQLWTSGVQASAFSGICLEELQGGMILGKSLPGE